MVACVVPTLFGILGRLVAEGKRIGGALRDGKPPKGVEGCDSLMYVQIGALAVLYGCKAPGQPPFKATLQWAKSRNAEIAPPLKRSSAVREGSRRIRVVSMESAAFRESEVDSVAEGGAVARQARPVIRDTVDKLPPSIDALLVCCGWETN